MASIGEETALKNQTSIVSCIFDEFCLFMKSHIVSCMHFCFDILVKVHIVFPSLVRKLVKHRFRLSFKSLNKST